MAVAVDDVVTEADIRWAMSYNAYERLAADGGELQQLLEPVRRAFATAGRVPAWCGVDLLRGWAFLLQREDYFSGGGTLGVEWHAILGALRVHPNATHDDVPPRPDTRERTAAGGTAAGRVLGVDACRAGWVGVVVDGEELAVVVSPRIDDLVTTAAQGHHLGVVGIDIPIGLPDSSRRQADSLARARVGRRSSSVFTTPVREALLAGSHAEAVTVNRARTGAGVSIQAYGLRTKVLEVDRWVRQVQRPVIEVHPEVSFAEMNGGGLAYSKSSSEGQRERLDLLHDQGIRIDEPLRCAGAGADDVLDAAAAAWTARRHAVGQAHSLPRPPETFSDGWPAAIWV